MRTTDLCIEQFPNEKDIRFNWTIMRSPHDRNLPLIVLAREPFGIRTHFWVGRTGPHYSSNCEACLAGRMPRWTGYLPCIYPGDGRQVLLEYTPPAAEQLQAIIRSQGFLRGTQIVASRAKKIKNARVTIASRGMYEHLDKLPPEPEVLPILFHIWGLKPRAETENGTYDSGALSMEEAPRRHTKPGAALDPSVERALRESLRDLPGQKVLPLDGGKRAS